MAKLWDSTLQLDLAGVRERLQEILPDLDFSTLTRIDKGWDNDIYLLEEKLIFRIARRTIAIPLIRTEIRALPLLQPLLPLPIPAIRHHGMIDSEHPFFSYRKLPGTIAADLALTEAERALLVEPIAGFMNALHSIPLSPDLRAVIPPDEFGRLDIVKRTTQIINKIGVTDQLGIPFDREPLTRLFPLLSQDEVRSMNCLVHGDLYARNILVRDRSVISGVIDWGDIHIGHPAKDVAFAVSFFGPPLLQQFIQRYRLFDQKVFRLATLAAISHTCHLAEYAIDINDDNLLQECRIIFRNVQENYAAYGSE